jgi:transcriptional regulator with XRE-family HTH domain
MENRPRINMEKTGERIINLREKAGLSVRMLADKLGYAKPQLIYDWQKGRVVPSADNLVALAYVFKVKVDDILITE